MIRGTWRGLEGHWLSLEDIQELLKDEGGTATWGHFQKYYEEDVQDAGFFRAFEPARGYGTHWNYRFYIVPEGDLPSWCPACESNRIAQPDYLCQGCRYGDVIGDGSPS
jgi:predicted Zn-ribbon and HTH transcriptional regulator